MNKSVKYLPDGTIKFYKHNSQYLRNIFFFTLIPGAFATIFSEQPPSAAEESFLKIAFPVVCLISFLLIIYSLIRFFKPPVAITLRPEGIVKPFYLLYFQIADISYELKGYNKRKNIDLNKKVTFSNLFGNILLHNSLFFKTKEGKTYKFNVEQLDRETFSVLRDILHKHGLKISC